MAVMVEDPEEVSPTALWCPLLTLAARVVEAAAEEAVSVWCCRALSVWTRLVSSHLMGLWGQRTEEEGLAVRCGLQRGLEWREGESSEQMEVPEQGLVEVLDLVDV